MVQALKKKLKSEKGFTLIELLAVIVILGILAAIAIPSILGLIGNSKKDAQVANAQQMVSAAKNAVASNDLTWTTTTSGTTTTTTAEITLSTLITNGYLENPKNPEDNADYNTSSSKVVVTKSGNTLSYSVTLVQQGEATASPTTYFDAASPTQLKRANVGVAHASLQ